MCGFDRSLRRNFTERELVDDRTSHVNVLNTMISHSFTAVNLIFYALLVFLDCCSTEENITVIQDDTHLETALAKLVKMFSKPGAFERVNSILGENSIEESSSCPKGEEGLDCRRAEARRSVDCPHGDCYCYNCSAAGPEMWAPCCRESLRCCSYLAAACRNCDHPALYPFCSKHFKKCLVQFENENTANVNDSGTIATNSK